MRVRDDRSTASRFVKRRTEASLPFDLMQSTRMQFTHTRLPLPPPLSAPSPSSLVRKRAITPRSRAAMAGRLGVWRRSARVPGSDVGSRARSAPSSREARRLRRGGCVGARAWGARARQAASPELVAHQTHGSQAPSVANAPTGGALTHQLALCASWAACALSAAVFAAIIAAVPVLRAFREAAIEVALLARTLREETPDTLAAVRLSGVEVADCVEEIGELSADLTRSIRTSARAVAATGGVVADGAQAVGRTVKTRVVPAVKTHVVPAASKTVKGVLHHRASIRDYHKPAMAVAAGRTAAVIRAARTLLVARRAARGVTGGGKPVQDLADLAAREDAASKED